MTDGIDPEEEGVVKAREMFDAEIPEVDIVSGPASGMRFVVIKADERQDPASIERIRKAERKPAPKYKGVTQAAKDKFSSDIKDTSKNSAHDLGSACRRLSQYAASGNLPHGTTYGDLKWMYNQICAELKRRDPKSTAGGNFPALGSGS
jgi:hypothetical protein